MREASLNAERHQIGLASNIIPDSRATSPGISKLIKAGVDLPTVQKISGHKVLTMVCATRMCTTPISTKAMTALAQPLPLALPGEFKKAAQ
jgi:hypothetical protein